jgi:hypothetical protein
MEPDWLIRKISIEEAETLNMVSDKRLGHESVPFGFIYQSWQILKSLIEEGDELWEFSSPKETWEYLMGREGIVLMRKGKEVAHIITREN